MTPSPSPGRSFPAIKRARTNAPGAVGEVEPLAGLVKRTVYVNQVRPEHPQESAFFNITLSKKAFAREERLR